MDCEGKKSKYTAESPMLETTPQALYHATSCRSLPVYM